jgi:hypothetical protein
MNYQEFINELINERDKNTEEWIMDVVERYHGEKNGSMSENIMECSVCLDKKQCIKQQNCDHYLCPTCYHKIHSGFISDQFYHSFSRPTGPLKPDYPYNNEEELTNIYNSFTDDENYKERFISKNEDLYSCVMEELEFIESNCIGITIYKIKQWFERDEKITKYKENLIKFYNEYKLFEEQSDLYDKLYEEEKKRNAVKKCPLCRK